MTDSRKTFKEQLTSFFRRLGGFIKRHKKLFIVLVILAIIAGIVISVIGNMRSAVANFTQKPQTITLERMDLNQIVSGTGTLQSGMTREVTSSLSYDILEIYVEEGDRVEAEQLLAQLDTTEIDKQIANVRTQITQAEESDALALAQAERKLQDAINQRDIDDSRLAEEVQNAQNSLNTAIAEGDAAQTDVNNKQAVLSLANEAVSNYPAVGEAGHDAAEYAGLQQAASQAQTAYDAAVQTHEAKKTAADQAQTAYDAAVQNRETAWRTNSISIENAQDTVNTQKIKDSASTYRTQLKDYLDEKEKCMIKAPISGTITAMTAEVGSSAGGGTGSAAGATTASSALFTIEDTSRLEIKSSIPEYDAITVKTGMQVSITSDAVSDAEWRGSIKSISSKATDDNGNFTVVVEVTSPVGDLAIGMSAKINIITESRKNVFAVPYDAVTTNPDGTSVVYVLSDENMTTPLDAGRPAGAPDISAEETQPAGTPVKVQTGMETDYYIEISGDGLEEGMMILADPESKNISADTGDFPFRPGGGF